MSPSMEWWRWLLLALFFSGLFAAWWWARRGRLRGGPAGGRRGRLGVRERVYLDARTSVSLVEADGRRFLLAHQANGAVAWQPLDTTSQPEPAP